MTYIPFKMKGPSLYRSPAKDGGSTEKGGHHPMYSGSSTRLEEQGLQPGGDPVHGPNENPGEKEKSPKEESQPVSKAKKSKEDQV